MIAGPDDMGKDCWNCGAQALPDAVLCQRCRDSAVVMRGGRRATPAEVEAHRARGRRLLEELYSDHPDCPS